MKGTIFIDNFEIGFVDFKVIDESMGVIGGDFIMTEKYAIFKARIQKFTELNGNANSQDFNFKIVVEDHELYLMGGISLVDSKEFGEMYLDAAGINKSELKNFKK